jgi:serine/threonine protein kinase
VPHVHIVAQVKKMVQHRGLHRERGSPMGGLASNSIPALCQLCATAVCVKTDRDKLRQPIEAYTVKSLMWQLLNGLAFMEQNWIIHRDLKPSVRMLAN